MSKVLDFKKKREESIEQKRRNFERVLFNNLLGAYSVVDQDGMLYPIDLVDVSHDGCLFQLPWDVKSDKKLPNDHDLTLRMYFTKESYIPIVVTVKNAREYMDKNGHTYMQYGCIFDKSFPSFEAFSHFIAFTYKFAEHSAVDHGDAKVFTI